MLLVLAGGVLLASQRGLLQPHRFLVWSAVGVTIAAGLWQSVRPGLEAARAARITERDRQLALKFRAHMWAIAGISGVDVRDLGMSLYVLRRRLLRGPVLERLLRERQLPSVLPTSVSWRPGKGIVGACVQERRALARDVGLDHEAFGDATRAEWDTGVVPDDVKQGMSYDEFERITGKYGAIFAVPLIDPTGRTGRVIGCLSLDGPPGSFPRLDVDAIHGELAYCADEAYTLLAE